MIRIVTSENRALYKRELLEMHKQRKRVFIDQEKWELVCENGLEIDQYDTPNAIYLLHLEGERLMASARLSPTNTPHLMSDYYSFLCAASVPRGAEIAEITRFCPHPETLGTLERARLARKMIAGVLEAGLLFGFEQLTFIASASLLQVVERAGWDLKALGPVCEDPSGSVSAHSVEVSGKNLRTVRSRYRLGVPITRYQPGAIAA